MKKTIQDYLEHPLTKGSILGASVMVAATPGINYVVSQVTNKPMPWSKPFTGAYPLSVSGAAGSATAFAIKSLLGGDRKDTTEWTRFWTALVAGGVSGIVLCPFEGIAQTQLSTNPKMSLSNTIHTINQYHGVSGFFRGTLSMMLRESAWVAMYIAAVPILSQRLKKSGFSSISADGAALVISAGIFGVASAPIQRARIMMQANLREPKTPHKTYGQVLTTMISELPNARMPARTARFFQGAAARSATSALAGGLFLKGSELYDIGVELSKSLGAK